jgi:predicted RNase H-like nuclease (RuvC/YqgF family)
VEYMQGIDWGNIISIVVALFGGGVIGVVVKAHTEKGKLNAEATNTNIKSLLEIDQRMNERMAKLEERVANLEQENYKLKTEKLSLEKETHKLKLKISELEEENMKLHEENEILRRELENVREEVINNGGHE